MLLLDNFILIQVEQQYKCLFHHFIKRGGIQMTKADVQKLLKDSGLRQWQLAEALGISEYTLCKRLRHPLTEEFEADVRRTIETLKGVTA